MKNNNLQKGFATPLIIGIIVVVILIAGAGYFAIQNNSSKTINEDVEEVMMEKEGETMMEKKEDGAMMEKEGETMMEKYSGTVLAGKSALLLDFTKADYEIALKTDKLIVLYFYANWCPTCKAEFPKAEAAFNELTTDKVIGFRVNFNDNQTDSDEKSLASQFGVPYQHTKVFVKNGQRILKSPETWDKNRYILEINKALAQ